MARSELISHVAVSVPAGTLTDEYRERLLAVYGPLLGWREIEALRREDRATIAIGPACYINLRERADGIGERTYEHIGITVRSLDEFEQLYAEVRANHPEAVIENEPDTVGRVQTFRMRYLLPMGVEVQYFPPGTGF